MIASEWVKKYILFVESEDKQWHVNIHIQFQFQFRNFPGILEELERRFSHRLNHSHLIWISFEYLINIPTENNQAPFRG